MFRSAAESDVVWERFLPSDYQSIISGSVDLNSELCCSSKKELYLRLCNYPILIDGGTKSFSLDKFSGKKCYMLAARDLLIAWGDTHRWRWYSLPEARFSEIAELVGVCWLKIRGKITASLLSPSTLYAAYFVFKSTMGAIGFDHQSVEVTFGLSGSESSKRAVYLCRRRRGFQITPRRPCLLNSRQVNLLATPLEEIGTRPYAKEYAKERGDGWLEVELGQYFTGEDEEGELEMSVLEVKGGGGKGGIFVQGIEIRPKKT